MSGSRVRSYGLKKRCACGRTRWSRCSHPWHFGFHWAGHEYRHSLHVVARLDRSVVMSQADAVALAERLRADIRKGTHAVGRRGTVTSVAHSPTTVSEVVDVYLRRHVWALRRRATAARPIEQYVRMLERLPVPSPSGPLAFGSLAFTGVTKADLEAVREARRAELAHCTTQDRVRPGCQRGEVGLAHLMATARQLWNWAITEGLSETTPFKRGGVSVIRVASTTPGPRTRRLSRDEEERLLDAASPHLRGLVVAALETGCRLGELLSLQWHQVRRQDGVLLLPSSKTKTAVARDVPITRRLRTALDARWNPAVHRPDVYVFGDDGGRRVQRVITAWRGACRRAGLEDLHFHDLRREFASRLLEAGASNHAVRDWLGHTNLTTTNRYLSTTRVHLLQARALFERGRAESPSVP